MSRSLGWVVVEFNQASGQPETASVGVCRTRQEAEVELLDCRATAYGAGRRETYTVAELIEQGGND